MFNVTVSGDAWDFENPAAVSTLPENFSCKLGYLILQVQQNQ